MFSFNSIYLFLGTLDYCCFCYQFVLFLSLIIPLFFDPKGNVKFLIMQAYIQKTGALELAGALHFRDKQTSVEYSEALNCAVILF